MDAALRIIQLSIELRTLKRLGSYKSHNRTIMALGSYKLSFGKFALEMHVMHKSKFLD